MFYSMQYLWPTIQEERFQALENLASAKKKYAALEKELGAYGACDPAKVEEKKRGVFLAHEAAIRWTGKIRRKMAPGAYHITDLS